MKHSALFTILLIAVSCGDSDDYTIPPAPYNLTAVRTTDTEVRLSWEDSFTGGGTYKIYRAVNTSAYEFLSDVRQGTLTYKDASVSATAAYSYYLVLFDKAGHASENSVVASVNGLQDSQMSPFAIPDKHLSDSPFAITAPTTLNPEPIVYSSSNASVAIVGGNVITIVGVGTTVITASQPMSFSYASALQTANFNVLP